MPCGSWSSPITSQVIAAGGLRLGGTQRAGDAVYWIEGRPAEEGRQVVVRALGEGAPVDVTPEGVNVRTRVHEYGGGDYHVARGRLFFVGFADQRLYSADAEPGANATPLTSPGSRWADFSLSPDDRWLVAVEEVPREGQEPENRLSIVPTAGGPPAVVAAGHDFYSSPRFSPDGRRLAFLAWDHPNMPWDGTRLYVMEWGGDGPAGTPRQVAGGECESIDQLRFSPAGVLTFGSDRAGWWNLHQLRGETPVAICPREAEFGRPHWVFGMSTWGFVSEDELLCVYTETGRDHLAHLDVASGALRRIDLPFTLYSGLSIEGGVASFVAGGPTRPGAIVRMEVATHTLRELRSSTSLDLDPSWLSTPEPIEFASAGGRDAHAFFYPPRHPDVGPLADERPPLLVKSHGGPTSSTSAALNPAIQYWTSRGIGVVDVNYGGSTGYGREYRERLAGQWGVVDVEDCVHAALSLAREGRADPERLTISGGSAGGYTTLCALTFHDAFRAGASHYGIGDLEALARDTHKFESRYLDKLIGPYPARRDLYQARSPIHFTEQLACPVAFFQGLEDRVVPPSQAEAMVEALANRGIPHVYVAFPGEQHGFRKAENICTALDGELFFYAQVFGFDVEVRPEAAKLVR